MNERIKQLYDQCFVVLEHDTPNTGFDANKFAELIVQECAELLENQHTWVTNVAASKILRKHFGIE